MQTPPINRKRGTIDLTRSDSEDEAPKRRLKRRRRVIEIESDDDDDEAPVPKKTLPWETPEWQAHCAKVREENAPIDDIMETFYASSRIHRRRQAHGAHAECAGPGVDGPKRDRLHRTGGRQVFAEAQRPLHVRSRGPGQLHLAVRAARLRLPVS